MALLYGLFVLTCILHFTFGQVDLLPHTQPNTSSTINSLVLASCYDKDGSTMPAALDRIVSQNPDLFLWMGDNIYANTEDMAVMRQKYDDKKRMGAYQSFLEAGIPVMANWDDHDFGGNNEGKYYPMRAESQLEFLRHFDVPQEDPRYSGREGIYSSKVFGTDLGKSLHVIMLDNRYGRSPTYSRYGACEGDSSKMLSEEQWQWLDLELKLVSELKIITNGIQILPPTNLDKSPENYCSYGDGILFNQAISSLGETGQSGPLTEKWGEIPTERERLLRMAQESINQGFTKNIIFASGDVHHAELHQKTMPSESQGGGEVTLFELTASGLGKHFRNPGPNPNRLPVWADYQGTGSFDRQCKFPFVNEGIEYRGCVYDDPSLDPWCYTAVDSDGNGVEGEWGFCAPAGAVIPTGFVGALAADIETQTSQDRHVINRANSNYGKIDIDWDNELITLSIQNEYEEVVSTIIPFSQDRLKL